MPLLQVLGFVQQTGTCWDVCFCIFLSHKANEFRPSLSRYLFSFSSTYLCIVIVIEQPMCKICRKGSKLYTDGRRKFNWRGSYFADSCQDSFLPSMYHIILSYWAGNWTFLFTLRHFWVLPAPYYIIYTLVIMRKLAGTTWGANEQIRKTVYEGSVRPVLEYSSTAWSTTNNP